MALALGITLDDKIVCCACFDNCLKRSFYPNLLFIRSSVHKRDGKAICDMCKKPYGSEEAQQSALRIHEMMTSDKPKTRRG